MWLVFGIISIVTGLLNMVLYLQRKEVKWLSFISLSTTSLTLCAFYSANAKWVANEDWIALMDVTPTLSNALWTCTIVSILINSVSLCKRKDK